MPSLRALVAEELAIKADKRVVEAARAIAAKYGEASCAVLFYGSCLRLKQLDGLMLDFYLIVSDYRVAYGKSWLSAANALVPPNVFYIEHDGLAAKYAVLSEADFRRECGANARSVSVLARFAQPSRLVWQADRDAGQKVIDAIADAAPTLVEWTIPLCDPDVSLSVGQIWTRAFSLTFGAELRAERKDRSARIVADNPARYETFGQAALAAIATERGVGPNGEVPLLESPARMTRRWKAMQRKGKLLSVIRLAKASLTFAGGPDYIAWKINRHAGTEIVLKPWQRRFPLLAALSLLPKLLRSGAVR